MLVVGGRAGRRADVQLTRGASRGSNPPREHPTPLRGIERGKGVGFASVRVDEQHRRALARILASDQASAPDRVVTHFLDYLKAQHLQIDWCQTVEARGQLIAAAVAVLSPGRTAMVMPATASASPEHMQALEEIIQAFCKRGAASQLRLLQTLIPDRHGPQCEVLGRCGFSHLAELLYLIRESAPLPANAESLCLEVYSDARREQFKSVLTETYQESLDCPALSGLRSMDDVFASHRATGLHDPALWYLVHNNEQPAGVLLMTRVPLRSALEIVYVGVVPEVRGRGLGRRLIETALHRAHLDHQQHVMLAVDADNHFAVNVYTSLGFARTESRHAWIRALNTH